jgi:hypothetical protein
MGAPDYVTMMASLPALPPFLGAKRPPINRVRLEGRLRQLRPEHRAELDRLGALLSWRRLPMAETDADLAAEARRTIPALSSETLRLVARDRMELRTVVAALRRRHAGEDAPPWDAAWGYGRFTERLRAGWREPEFGLARAFPWLPAARVALEKGEAAELERLLLEAVWRNLSRHAEGHAFDYEAAALYALKWALVDRWAVYDADHAAARFRRMTADALAAAPDPVAGEAA